MRRRLYERGQLLGRSSRLTTLGAGALVLTLAMTTLRCTRAPRETSSGRARPRPLLPTSTSRGLMIVAGDGALQNVFLNLSERYAYHYSSTMALPAADLARVRALVVTRGGEFTDIDAGTLERWVEAGGTLILVGPPTRSVRAASTGLLGAQAQFGPANTVELTASHHPLLYDTTGKAFFEWRKVHTSALLTPGTAGDSPLRAGAAAAVWVRQVGRGRVAYLAPELFPPFPKKTDDWNPSPHGLGAFLRTLLEWAGAPRLADVGTGLREPVAWYREPKAGWLEGARTELDPLPAAGELTRELTFVAGRNEHERRMLFTTAPPKALPVSVIVTDLRSRAGTIPAHRIKVGYQGRITPTYHGPLVFIRWLASGERVTDPSPVTTWWIDLATGDAAPGTYTGKVSFKFASGILDVPLVAEIFPVRMPARRPFDFSAEFMVFDPRRVWRDTWPEHWEELGINFFTAGRSQATVRATGEPLVTHAIKSKTPLRDSLPLLDFTDSTMRWDRILANALSRGMTRFRTYYVGGAPIDSLLPLAKALYRDERLNAQSPELAATAHAFLEGWSRFLRERGYQHLYSKALDEWSGSEALEHFLRYAVPLRKAGWRTVANPDVLGILSDRTTRQKVWPHIDLYWMEGDTALWQDIKGLDRRANDAEAKRFFSIATSSHWWDREYLEGPRYAWAAAFHQNAGFHLHGWGLRGKYGAENVYYLDDRRQVSPSLGLLMFAEGMDDAQYATLLQRLLTDLESKETTRSTARALRARWRALVGDSAGATLRVERDRIAAETSSRAGFIEARRELFSLISQAKAAAVHLNRPVSLRWRSLWLVRDGRAAAELLFDPPSQAAAAALVRQVAADTGVQLRMRPLSADPAAWQKLSASVVFASTTGAVGAAVSSFLQGAVNARYPAPGGYVLHEDAARNVWVLGDSLPARALGAKNLVVAATLEPVWFEPVRGKR